MTRACLLLNITLALTGLLRTSDGCDNTCQVSCSAVQGECLASLPPLPPSTHDSACSNIRNAPDVCKRAQQLKACLHGKLSEECMTVPWFSHYIDTVRNTTRATCSDAFICDQGLSKCICLAQSEDSSNPTANLFSHWPEAIVCFDRLQERCGSSSTMMTRITDMRSVFSTGFYMMCDPDGGVCPELWRCVEGVAAILRDAQPTDYDVICTLAPYLDCFANASSTCRVDQGTVTFVQIRGVVDELCKVLPQSTDVLDCPQVQQCVNETILSNFGTHDTGTGDQRWNYVYNWAHVTRTGFWCSTLKKGYKCTMDNDEACGVQTHTTTARRQFDTLNHMCVGAATLPPINWDKYKSTSSGADSVRGLSERCILVSAIVLLLV